jgi:hypothetical protein
MAAGDWQAVSKTITAEPRPEIRDHPVIQSFGVIAETRSGRRNGDLARQIKELESTLRPARDRYPDLFHQLELAYVEQLLALSYTPENLSRNTDEILRRLGTATRRDVDIRIRTAATFEDVADRKMSAASGFMQKDPYAIQEARSIYQTGLRLLVTPDGWATLEPISPSANPAIARILEKIRAANRSIHGPALPFTDRDPETWSGKRGDPVHDAF